MGRASLLEVVGLRDNGGEEGREERRECEGEWYGYEEWLDDVDGPGEKAGEVEDQEEAMRCVCVVLRVSVEELSA